MSNIKVNDRVRIIQGIKVGALTVYRNSVGTVIKMHKGFTPRCTVKFDHCTIEVPKNILMKY
jgi:hypothetical protein